MNSERWIACTACGDQCKPAYEIVTASKTISICSKCMDSERRVACTACGDQCRPAYEIVIVNYPSVPRTISICSKCFDSYAKHLIVATFPLSRKLLYERINVTRESRNVAKI